MTGILSSTMGTFFSGQKITVTELAKTFIKTAGTNNLNSGAISTVAGRVYVVMLAWDPSGVAVPTVTLSDTANTYTALSTLYPAPIATTGGGGVIIQSFITTAAATASRTITATFSASITSKAMIVLELQGATTTQRNAATTSRGTTAAPNYTTPSGNQYDMILVTWAQESATTLLTGSASTVGGVWSALSSTGTSGGNALTNITLAYQYKLLTVTGTQSWGGTLGSTNNWGSQSFALQAA